MPQFRFYLVLSMLLTIFPQAPSNHACGFSSVQEFSTVFDMLPQHKPSKFDMFILTYFDAKIKTSLDFYVNSPLCTKKQPGILLPGIFFFAPFYTIWDIGKIMSCTRLHTKSRSLINILFFCLIYFVKLFKDFLCGINAV